VFDLNQQVLKFDRYFLLSFCGQPRENCCREQMSVSQLASVAWVYIALLVASQHPRDSKVKPARRG
jgi:hypothetical protein